MKTSGLWTYITEMVYLWSSAMTHYRYSFVISVGEELAELSTRLPFSVNDIDQLTLKRLFEDLLVLAIINDSLLNVKTKYLTETPPQYAQAICRAATDWNLRQTLYRQLNAIAYSYGFDDWELNLEAFDKVIIRK